MIKVVQLLIQFRNTYGVVKREVLNLAFRGNLSSEVLDLIDFSVPKQDPFDIDLRCLPSVPKTDSWEPLVSFAHQSASIRSRSPSKPKTGPWQPLTSASGLSRSRSPSEPETDIWQHLTLNSPRSRQESPKSKVSAMLAKSPAFQDLGLEPNGESISPVRSSFAMLAAASKVPKSSAMLATASEVHEPQVLHSYRTSFNPMSHGEQRDMSGSRQKQSSKPKQTTSGTEKIKGTDEAAEIFKSETESRSHAAEPSKGATCSSKSSRSKVNRSPISSGSASRSRSVRRSLRKSDSQMVKSPKKKS